MEVSSLVGMSGLPALLPLLHPGRVASRGEPLYLHGQRAGWGGIWHLSSSPDCIGARKGIRSPAVRAQRAEEAAAPWGPAQG